MGKTNKKVTFHISQESGEIYRLRSKNVIFQMSTNLIQLKTVYLNLQN